MYIPQNLLRAYEEAFYLAGYYFTVVNYVINYATKPSYYQRNLATRVKTTKQNLRIMTVLIGEDLAGWIVRLPKRYIF